MMLYGRSYYKYQHTKPASAVPATIIYFPETNV